jgi:hypothetical protein
MAVNLNHEECSRFQRARREQAQAAARCIANEDRQRRKWQHTDFPNTTFPQAKQPLCRAAIVLQRRFG